MEVTSISYVIILIFQFGLISADYEYICDEKLLRKPYVKIYNTKSGDIILDETQSGFYDVSRSKNIYVCINGPVVLYFTRHLVSGDVFDEARNTLGVHKCQHYNGEPGPGSTKKADDLKAILLMGDERDYTLPNVKTFTAPLLIDANTGSYENVTSVITLGAHNCEIFKGPYKQSILFSHADSNAQFRMCRLPYQTINQWSIDSPTDTKMALKNENFGMEDGKCTRRIYAEDLTVKILMEFSSTIGSLEELKNNFQDKYPIPPDNKVPVIKTLKSNITSTTHNISGSSNVTELEFWRSEITVRQAELAALEAQQLFYDLYTTFKSKIDAAASHFNTPRMQILSMEPKVRDVEKNIKEKQDLENQYEDTDPRDAVELRRINDLIIAKIGEINVLKVDLEAIYVDTLPRIEGFEATLKQGKYIMDMLPLVQKEMTTATQNKDKRQKYNANTFNELKLVSQSLPLRITVDIHGNQNPSPANPPPATTAPICIPFPLIGEKMGRRTAVIDRGTCYGERGTKLFGCQLLKARLGHPSICALDEEDSTPDGDVPTKDVPPVTDVLPQHMIDILNLINQIYKKACTRIRSVFAERVNNLLQCYLIKDRVNKNQTSTDGPGTTPNRLKFWKRIIGALEDCRDAGHVLKFARESPEVAKYYLMKDDDYLEVNVLKEQAENEYEFNFAIDMSWKVFATVLGLCMPSYESKIPLITTRFFTMFTEEFLQPIQEIWISEKDNNIFKRIMSYYYAVGGAEPWATYCMEASFLYSSDVTYRPPRKLPVNGRTESNYFIKKKKKKKRK